MVIPPFLKPGDSVYLLSTARAISHNEVRYAIQIIEDWGFRVKVGDTIGKAYHQYAGTDEERKADMECALRDNEVKAIIFARGGYGSARIVDEIAWHLLIEHPKWIAGYSDVTALHSHIQRQCSIATLHSSMPINFSTNSPVSLITLQEALYGRLKTQIFGGHELNRSGTAKGVITGGNLSVLYSLTATESAIETEGKILLLEDVDEYLYHIDRMMLQLSRSGKLRDLAGLLVGSFTQIHDNTIAFGQSVNEIIAAHVSMYDYPVGFGIPCGHGDENHTLYFGVESEIRIEREGILLEYK